ERNGFDFTYEVLGTEYHDVNIQDDPWLKPILRPAEFTRIYVDGHAVYNGWEFVAKVEATDEGNIITGPPNSRTVPEHYRTDKLVCDHCDHNRKRKHGFIVREHHNDVGKRLRGFSEDVEDYGRRGQRVHLEDVVGQRYCRWCRGHRDG